MCTHIDPSVPYMAQVILVGDEAGNMMSEQLCLLFYRNHHYLVVNLTRKCWCTLSYLGYYWQVDQTSFLVHNCTINFDFSNSSIYLSLFYKHLFRSPIHVAIKCSHWRDLFKNCCAFLGETPYYHINIFSKCKNNTSFKIDLFHFGFFTNCHKMLPICEPWYFSNQRSQIDVFCFCLKSLFLLYAGESIQDNRRSQVNAVYKMKIEVFHQF